MKVNDIIMELELPHHNKPNYKGLGSKPHEIKSRVNKRDYNFAPTNAGIKGQLYQQVDKKLQPLIYKLAQLKGHTKDDLLYQRIANKEMYIQSALDA